MIGSPMIGGDRVYPVLLGIAGVASAAAVALADDAGVRALSVAVLGFVLATLWRHLRARRLSAWAMSFEEEEDMERQVITQQFVHSAGKVPVSADAANVPSGRVESWDEEAGWGVLSAPELPSGVFAHFSVVEGEGYRSLKVGGPVSFDYVEAAGGPGSQDGCSYVAERVVELPD